MTTIFVLTLLTLPSTVAAHWARGMKSMVILSSGTALFLIFIGLEAAANLD